MKINVFRFYASVWDTIRTLRGSNLMAALKDYDDVRMEDWIADEYLEVWI